MSAFVAAVCEYEFDAAPVRVEHIATGNVKETSVAELPDGRTVVVQWSETDLSSEAHVLRRIGEQTDVPVPRVEAIGRRRGRSYFVTEFVPGANLHARLTAFDPDARERILRELGAHLAAVHDGFRFEGHGPILASDGALTIDRPRSWRRYLRGLLDEGLAELPAPLSDLHERIDAAVDPMVLPSDPVPRLYPWDYRPGNVLVRDGAVVAALDWGDPRTAHRELSVAKTEYCTVDWYAQGELREAFYEGYESVLPLEEGYRRRRRQYRLVAIVRSAVTSRGSVTRPGYPMVDTEAAIEFHRRALESLI